jgi:L-ascorbate metabolism protein UlaG (beta-lactamase superfamily)
MRLLLFGHMTVWVELDGVCFLTDPWFGPHGRLERWLAPRTIPPAVDAVALSRVCAILASQDRKSVV